MRIVDRAGAPAPLYLYHIGPSGRVDFELVVDGPLWWGFNFATVLYAPEEFADLVSKKFPNALTAVGSFKKFLGEDKCTALDCLVRLMACVVPFERGGLLSIAEHDAETFQYVDMERKVVTRRHSPDLADLRVRSRRVRPETCAGDADGSWLAVDLLMPFADHTLSAAEVRQQTSEQIQKVRVAPIRPPRLSMTGRPVLAQRLHWPVLERRADDRKRRWAERERAERAQAGAALSSPSPLYSSTHPWPLTLRRATRSRLAPCSISRQRRSRPHRERHRSTRPSANLFSCQGTTSTAPVRVSTATRPRP